MTQALQAKGRFMLVQWFYIIDGAVLYERDEHCDEALPVPAFLLSLTADPGVSATAKLLFASTPGPDTSGRRATSNERLVREFGDG
ncbi:hypothetical protein BDZ45DRAFT_754772 [Acephala macrosclerotiorum]|nr:hypothetical protein BDZ45DRAFT_754772 [Acephala macrosclerotiorum]